MSMSMHEPSGPGLKDGNAIWRSIQLPVAVPFYESIMVYGLVFSVSSSIHEDIISIIRRANMPDRC